MDSDENSLQSLTSSITSYVYRNGRRYASFREGRYCLPNDEVGLFFCFCFSSASSNIARPSRIAMTSSNIYTACSLAGGSSLRPYQTVQRGYSTSAQAQASFFFFSRRLELHADSSYFRYLGLGCCRVRLSPGLSSCSRVMSLVSHAAAYD